MRAVVFALLLAVSSPSLAVDPQHRLLDLSADTLQPGEWEVGLFWAKASRGITPNLQLSTHALGLPAGVVNLFAKWRFLDRPELRLSVDGGFVWVASAALFVEDAPLLLFFPLELRASVPLSDQFELHVGAIGRWTVTNQTGTALGTSTLRMDVSLARTDDSGAWIATGRFPLVTRASVRLDSLLGATDVAGSLVLDELASWGVLIARDQLFGERLHARFGIGYRNTYGIVLYESLGHLLLTFDLYWRRPPG